MELKLCPYYYGHRITASIGKRDIFVGEKPILISFFKMSFGFHIAVRIRQVGFYLTILPYLKAHKYIVKKRRIPLCQKRTLAVG